MKMIKIAAVAAGAALAVAALAGCSQPSAPSNSSNANSTSNAATAPSNATPSNAAPANTPPAQTNSGATQTTQEYIGEQAAMDAALAHAGFTPVDVTELKAELDLDDAVVHYDVDFKQGGLEYDYDIDATTGDVISSHSEVDD